jgi:cephalosporin-C deacetylase-like acetyl esterase
MVTRRAFLVGNATAAAHSAFKLVWPDFVAAPGALGEPTQISRSDRDFWIDWPDFITTNMNQAGASRKAILAGIQSKQQVADRSTTVRTQLWEILGGRPQETPLNARTVGTIERKGYKIDKVVYESMPQVYVTANLYVPTTGKGPYPGIVVPLGHVQNGKAYRNYQYSFQSLARKGYVVLAYDPFGQGERRQYGLSATGHPRFTTGEHLQAGRPMILFGSSFALYRTWDGIRSLDYLLSRPEVDAQRVGCTGHSGGATMTMYLMALDPRIQVAVAVEGNYENMAVKNFDPPGAIADAEQNLVGGLPLGLDRGDMLAAFAPKPFLMSYTVHDQGQTYSPLYEEAIEENYQELLRIYGILGAADKVQRHAGNLPHDLDFFQRRAMYGWFNRWFDKTDAGVEEEDFDDSPETDLNCTTTGQVLTSLGGRSVVQLNCDHVKQLLPRSKFSIEGGDPSSAREHVRAQLKKMLALPSKPTSLNERTLSSDAGRKSRIEAIQYESEPGVRITGWFVRANEGVARQPCVLFIGDGLADEVVAEPSVFDQILSQGQALCAITLRGTGISMPRPPYAGPRFYMGMPVEERIAWTNLVLGSSVIGQRVWDIVRALDYLESRADVDSSQIRILGRGPAGLAALMAAALDERVQAVLIQRTLATYSSIVNSEEYEIALDWFAPGILKHFDLPDITAAIYPRPVWIVDAVDAQAGVLSESAVRESYSKRIPLASVALKKVVIRTTTEDDKELYIDWLKHGVEKAAKGDR